MWVTVTTVSGKRIALNMALAYKIEPRSTSEPGCVISFAGATETVQESLADLRGRIETTK